MAKLGGILTQRDFIRKTSQYGVYVHGQLGQTLESNLIDGLKKRLKEDGNIKELQEDDSKDDLQEDDNKDEVNCHDDYNIEEPDGPNKAEDEENNYRDVFVKDNETGCVYNAIELIKLQDIHKHAITNEKIAELNNKLTTNKLTISDVGQLIIEYKIKAPKTNNNLSDPYKLNPFHNASKDSIKTSGDIPPSIREKFNDNVQSELNSGAKLPCGVLQVCTDTKTKTPRGQIIRLKNHKVLHLCCYVNRSDKSHPGYQKVQNIRISMFQERELISLQEAISMGIVSEVVAYFIGTVYEIYKDIGMEKTLRFKKNAECWVAEIERSRGCWIECTKIYGKNDDGFEAKLPIEVEGTVIIPDMDKLKLAFDNNYNKVAAALEAQGEEEEEVRKMMFVLKSKGVYEFYVGTLQRNVTIKHDMFKMTKEKKTIYKRVCTYVVEVSFRIGRVVCCLYEQSYKTKPGKAGKPLHVFSFPSLVAPYKCFVIKNKKYTNVTEHIVVSLGEARIRYLTAAEGSHAWKKLIMSDVCGCPFAVRVNSKDLVTIRERDSNRKISVKVDEVRRLIEDLLSGVRTWTDICEKYPPDMKTR